MKIQTGLASIGMAALLLTGINPPAYAQKNIPKVLHKLLLQKKLVSQPNLKKDLHLNTKALDAITFSKISNQGGFRSVAPLFRPNFSLFAPRPLQPPPALIRRAVFTLRYDPQSRGSGSAFAVMINKEVWGVTARHVLDDIGRSPFMSVNDKSGKPVFFQIHSVREGNIHGADIAIFRIPPKARAFITPLKPDYQLPQANSFVQSAGFSHGNFGWFSHVGVLFASKHRILARYEDFPILSGYCGSPLLKNGKVIGVFTGIFPAETAQKADWFKLLSREFKTPINSFNHIVPIDWVRMLVQETQHTNSIEGTPLKFLGKTLGLLHTDENVHSIQQLRNGVLIKTIYAYPFMDYNNLERFLDIAPTDMIRITLHKGDRSSSRKKVIRYDWDIATEKIERNEEKI